MRSFLQTPGHLAIWAGLYVAQAVTLVALLLDIQLPITAFLGSLILAISVYLMDRAKPADRFLDPADAEAHPARRAFIDKHRTAARAGALLGAIAAGVLLAQIDVLLALLVPLSHAGVLIYGSAPKSIRPKDFLFIKNAAVAGSVTLYALLVVIATQDVAPPIAPMTITIIVAAAHVFIDAMLCDIDDAPSDARHGTRTIPNTLGRAWTWAIAIIANLAIFAFLLTAALLALIDFHRAATIGIALTAATMFLRLVDPQQIRDATDIKFPLAVAIAWLLLR